MQRVLFTLTIGLLALWGVSAGSLAWANPAYWNAGEWPNTDFSKHSVDLMEIVSDGLPKYGIPPIDDPTFQSTADSAKTLSPKEQVVALVTKGKAKGYPLSVLIWHEIENDEVGGVPVTVTYCPLCNAAIVFDRRVGDQVLDFDNTGKLRKSDLLMWDRPTESWWQQFLGEAIAGEMTGIQLKVILSRMESFERFQRRRPDGLFLKPYQPDLRAYGRNPYVSYDSAPWSFLYRGESPVGISPLARVVAIGEKAYSLDLLRKGGGIKDGKLMLTWEAGQNSVLDRSLIEEGRDVGNVIVQESGPHGPLDVAHAVTFAFVFHGFRPEGEIYVDCSDGQPAMRPLVCR